MRIIGVIDLLSGCAVHARAGARERYAPVERAAGITLESGNAIDLARIYVDRLGVGELYIADLDAILGKDPQRTPIEKLASLGVPVWLDAGIASVNAAQSALDLGASHIVIGLETLPSFAALEAICKHAGHVAFSLDLRAGAPIVMPGSAIASDTTAEALAASAADAGVDTFLVIDLTRVGTGAGVDLELLSRLRAAAPGVTLVAGGGVRSPDDLAQLSDSGCDGALVATALHNGRIGAADVSAARLRP